MYILNPQYEYRFSFLGWLFRHPYEVYLRYAVEMETTHFRYAKVFKEHRTYCKTRTDAVEKIKQLESKRDWFNVC